MEYNICDICGASGGRAGTVISKNNGPHECMNCHETRETGGVVLYLDLIRTDAEIQKTYAILSQKESPDEIQT